MKCLEIISLKEKLIWLYDVGQNLQFNFCWLLIYLFFRIFRSRGFISLISGTFNIFKVKLEFGKYQSIYILEYIFLSIKIYGAFKLASNSTNIFSTWIRLYKNIDFLSLYFDSSQLKVIMTHNFFCLLFLFLRSTFVHFGIIWTCWQ